jgi:hypothetical protein
LPTANAMRNAGAHDSEIPYTLVSTSVYVKKIAL